MLRPENTGNDGLSFLQRLFVEHYTGDAHRGNATRAALIAGYVGTPGSVRVVASNLLRKPKVRAAIEARVPGLLQAKPVSPPVRGAGTVFLARAVGLDRYRLGHTELAAPPIEFHAWQGESPVALELVAVWPGPRELKLRLSKRFTERRSGSGWFTLDEAAARLLVEMVATEIKRLTAGDKV
ncbi:MAG: Terminase small subunit [Acidobacteriota bacterium]|jgi:hypothetical protein|nr:Terminase small subunit [Acidobacteriota bacterium]